MRPVRRVVAVEPTSPITFARDPGAYRHWQLVLDAPVATLRMQVDPTGGIRSDYELKLNSYDLAVDIELHDIVQRLRFEHPEIRAVVLTGGLDKVFCAGANIQMLAGATHHHKVNFCKFTNETRNAIEDASVNSGQVWLAAVNGTAAGGGYELALACDEIILVDDRSTSVSLPEVPLLGVLPGTGGLTRLVEKRYVRRDLADLFSTRTEGARGQQAVDWGLVDAVATRSRFDDVVHERAHARAAGSDRPAGGPGIALTPLERRVDGEVVRYAHVSVRVDRELGVAHLTVAAQVRPVPRRRTRSSPQGRASGHSRRAGSSTTRFSTCASTSPMWAPGCCAQQATARTSSAPTTCCATTSGTGSCARPSSSGGAR